MHLIVRPLGLHCNHYVSSSIRPSVRYQLVKMFKLLNHMVYFDQILHACQHSLTTGNCWHIDGASLIFTKWHNFTWLSENPHNSWTLWDIWLKFCILFLFILSSHWYAKRWRGFANNHFGRLRSFSEMLIILNHMVHFDHILHTYTHVNFP